MNRFNAWSLPLLGMTAIAIACSSSSSKKVRPMGDAGAAGEPPSESAGSGNAPSEGGAPGEAGAPPADAGAAGEAGASNAPLTVEALAGEWSGTLQNTYVCESSPTPLVVGFEGNTMTTSPWPNGNGSTGSIEQRDGSSFEVTFELPATEFTEGGTAHAQLFVEPSAHYALFVVQEVDSTNGHVYGNVALLERGAATDVELSDADLIGKWSGIGVRLDENLRVTESFDSSATFALGAERAVTFSGEDSDGAYADAETRDNSAGVWTSAPVPQGDAVYGNIYLLSSDKRVLATGLLRDLSPEDGDSSLCDLRVFTDMSIHKFALWTKAE